MILTVRNMEAGQAVEELEIDGHPRILAVLRAAG